MRDVTLTAKRKTESEKTTDHSPPSPKHRLWKPQPAQPVQKCDHARAAAVEWPKWEVGCAKCEMEEEWSPLCVVAAPKNCRSALYVAKGYGGTRNRLGLVSGGGKVHPRTLGMATTPQNGLLAVGLKAVSVLPPTRSSNRWRPRRAGVIRVRSNRPTLVPTTVHSGVHARSAPRHPPMAWVTRIMLSFSIRFPRQTCAKTSKSEDRRFCRRPVARVLDRDEGGGRAHART